MSILAPEQAGVEATTPVVVRGSVASVRGLTLLVDDLPLAIGALVHIHISSDGAQRPGEVIGFDGPRAVVMLLGATSGISSGDPVLGAVASPTVRVGERMLGRVMNGLGRPIDGKGPIYETTPAPLNPSPLGPLQRRRIQEALPTGVRAIDLMTTVGRGQRLGIFAGPGVGKSTLLGQIARNTEADVNVIALVGERGREVQDFIHASLGDEGLGRSALFVSTSDESPLLRIRAVWMACALAELYRDHGADVMLLMDSVTRFAQALRQVGLAVGEPPATKGYTPSVFAALPLLLERAGAVQGGGSITGIYTILVEGDDMTEPIADAARGVLDGHLILSRDLARKGHYPAIDPLDSISRVATEVTSAAHVAARAMIQRMLAAYRDVQDLVQIGAYARGSNPTADVAIHFKDRIDELLQQGAGEEEPFDQSSARLITLATEIGAVLQSAEAANARQE